MHSSCAGGDRQAATLPTTPDLLQLPRSMCLNAKVTCPSVFEALWGKAAPALAGAGYWLHLFLAADSRSSLPSKDPSLILRKQELKIGTGISGAGQLGKLSLTPLPATPTPPPIECMWLCNLPALSWFIQITSQGHQLHLEMRVRPGEWSAMIMGHDGEDSTGLRRSTLGLSTFPLGHTVSASTPSYVCITISPVSIPLWPPRWCQRVILAYYWGQRDFQSITEIIFHIQVSTPEAWRSSKGRQEQYPLNACLSQSTHICLKPPLSSMDVTPGKLGEGCLSPSTQVLQLPENLRCF